MELPAPLFDDILKFARQTHQAPVTGPEKRHAERLATSMPIKISRLLQGAMEPPVLAVLKDISPLGIGLIHSEIMLKDDLFIATLPRIDADPVKVRCAVVRWSTLGKDFFVIGATFNRVLSPEPAEST